MDIEDLRNQWVVQKAHNGLIYYFNKNVRMFWDEFFMFVLDKEKYLV